MGRHRYQDSIGQSQSHIDIVFTCEALTRRDGGLKRDVQQEAEGMNKRVCSC